MLGAGHSGLQQSGDKSEDEPEKSLLEVGSSFVIIGL